MTAQPAILSTLRVNIWNTISTLVNSNKSSGWTVLSAFPEQTPVFPCIIINPANVKVGLVTMDRSARFATAEVGVEFYSPAKNGKKDIDEEKDKICNAFVTDFDTLRNNNLVMATPDGIIDGDSDNFQYNQSKMNYGSLILSLKVI